MTQEKKVQIWKNLQGMFLFLFFFFFHPLSAFRGFPGAVPVSIASVDLIISLMYSILCFEALLQSCLFFFFWQPVAGLTNRVPVWDSRARAPLIYTACCLLNTGVYLFVLPAHQVPQQPQQPQRQLQWACYSYLCPKLKLIN